MFSSKLNIQQLTSLRLKSGIDTVVVCPGNRNAALVHNFHAASMTCYEVTDERSAGFFALGLIEANGGKPVAVCCTSGSAVLNLAPSVSEAFYRPLPLMVITADRPEMWIGQMDGQTMDQTKAFSGFVNKSVSLPEPNNEEERWYCNRLINEALVSLTLTRGPVHVNVRISEPMFDFSSRELPDERLVSVCGYSCGDMRLSDRLTDIIKASSRPMILVGQMLPETASTCVSALKKLAERGVMILAETLSNVHVDDELRQLVRYDFDDVLSHGEPVRPDLLITFGGHVVSKRIKAYLRKEAIRCHIHVDKNSNVVDTYMSLTDKVMSEPSDFLALLCDLLPSDVSEDYRKSWSAGHVKEDVPVLGRLFSELSDEWTLHLANSSTVRKVQRIFNNKNTVYCNRGINGIEGSVSSAVGFWAGAKKPTLLIVGDLSFFYDQNALWNNYVKAKTHDAPLRILIINNGGGEIFYNFPSLRESPCFDRCIVASHDTSAKGIAEECGCIYYKATDIFEFERYFYDFMNVKSKDVRIFEVFLSVTEIVN